MKQILILTLLSFNLFSQTPLDLKSLKETRVDIQYSQKEKAWLIMPYLDDNFTYCEKIDNELNKMYFKNTEHSWISKFYDNPDSGKHIWVIEKYCQSLGCYYVANTPNLY